MPAAGITLTERAAAHVRQFMRRRREDGGRLRVGVKDAGCSGYRYVVEAARELGANDRVFRSRGIEVVVDARSLLLLAGTELDYARKGLNEEFVFNNPNVTQSCGCGESFTVADSGRTAEAQDAK